MEAAFTHIYAANVWGGGSGGGSDVAYCAPLAAFLGAYLRDAGAARLVDLGCGDLRWMPAVVAAAGVAYTGVDCVPALLERHRAAHPGFAFVHADVAGTPPGALPDGDVYFVKDVLQHWPSATVDAWLRAFFAARPAAHLLVCNCSAGQRSAHRDIDAPGGAAPLHGDFPPLAAFGPVELLSWQTKTLYRLRPPAAAAAPAL
jgi:hypothetical protein